MLVFRQGSRDFLVLDITGVLYYVPMTVDAKGRLCRAEEAFQHISEYSGSTHHVFGTPYGVFGFVFEGGELVEAYRDKIAIGPVADFDKQRLVFTEDHVFLGIKA